jgi:hypothetical protein
LVAAFAVPAALGVACLVLATLASVTHCSNEDRNERCVGTVVGLEGKWTNTSRLALPVLIAGLVGLVIAIPALAVHATGAFELDGNAVNSTPLPAGDDWDNVCHQVLGSDCSTTSNTK